MGSNTILLVDEDFRNVEVRHVGEIKETHGFSSFKVNTIHTGWECCIGMLMF